MKKILAGCLAAAMFCGGMAMAEAPGGNSLRDKISAAGAGQATVELETAPGFMIPEAVDTETGFMVPEAVEEEAAAVPEGVQTRKPGSLMGQINAVKQGESVSVGIIGGADGPTNIMSACRRRIRRSASSAARMVRRSRLWPRRNRSPFRKLQRIRQRK